MQEYCKALLNSYQSSGMAVRFSQVQQGEDWVACRDGVKLLAFWYRPPGEGPWPAIVQRSCYPQTEQVYRLHGRELAKRGIAYLCQWCRGTGGSEGVWEPNVNEPDDGADFLRWVDSLPWVGSMGYWGCSYLAATGWTVTGQLPPKMRSLLLSHYGTERFTSAYESGLFRHDILTAWAMGNAGRTIDADYLESCRYRPHKEVDTALWGGELPWYRDWVTNTRPTDPYWHQGFWNFMAQAPRKLKLPVCVVEGWYDHHLGSALKTFQNLSPQAAAHSKLIVGCWNHGFQPCAQGKLQEHLENDQVRQMLSWFEETLLKGQLPRREVDWYVIGEDAWRSWEDYPQPGEEMSLALNAAGKTLEDTPGESARVSYRYDPENPVMSHGAESLLSTFQEVGSLLQPEPDWRPDVVSFLSRPLEEPLTLLGEIRVELYVKSTAPDTAFTAKLMEVTPQGEAYNIRGSIATLAFQEPYTPGEVRKVTISMWAVAYQVQAGCRLRLDLSSSDFPQYAIHPNKAGIWSEQESTTPAIQTILTGRDTPSRVILPLEKGVPTR